MVQTHPMQFLEAASVRAISSLSRRDVAAVQATVRAAAMGHTIQEHDDYDGYLSLLVAPADPAQPSFMVAGKVGAVDLAELWGDEMVALGTFPSIGAAMIVLRPALEREGHRVERPTATATALREHHGGDASLQAALAADAQPGLRHWSGILRALDAPGEGE